MKLLFCVTDEVFSYILHFSIHSYAREKPCVTHILPMSGVCGELDTLWLCGCWFELHNSDDVNESNLVVG